MRNLPAEVLQSGATYQIGVRRPTIVAIPITDGSKRIIHAISDDLADFLAEHGQAFSLVDCNETGLQSSSVEYTLNTIPGGSLTYIVRSAIILGDAHYSTGHGAVISNRHGIGNIRKPARLLLEYAKLLNPHLD